MYLEDLYQEDLYLEENLHQEDLYLEEDLYQKDLEEDLCLEDLDL